jgi:outer membrane lipoprotein-sorting protein
MMRSAMMRVVAVALVAALAGGCASGLPARRPASAPLPPLPEPEEALAAYQAYCRSVESVSASGDLEVRDLRAGKTQRLGVRLVAGRGGRLYIKGSVAVVTALEVVADGRRFWVQVPSKKTVWTGPAESGPGADAGTEEAPYHALRPADVVEALVPEPLAPGDGEALVMEAEGTGVSLTLADLHQGRGRARRQVTVERGTLRPLRLRRFDARGELQAEVRLGDWRDGSPRRVSIVRPAEGYEAAFALEKVQRNVALPERAFVPRTPASYRVVEVP